MTKIVRGTLATFKMRYYTSAGLPGTPLAAQIRLRYIDLSTNQAVLVDQPMSLVSGQYTYVWDSTPAAPGTAWGNVLTEGDEPVSVDFAVEVTANPANLP